ncbi:MAG: hypothetical protein GX066_07115 [Clostridiaceae bacterium]|nr:hypothetical protein [Clostridiaceae bacterium]
MKKKNITIEKKLKMYKRRFRIVLFLLIILILGASYYLYLNFDYLAFKHLITQHYIYPEALDQLYKEELKRDVEGDYFSYFDDLVISIVTQRIREKNNDLYTYLYIPEQYQQYLKEEKEEAEQSEIKVLDKDIIYLHITNFSKYTRKFVNDNLNQLEKYPYLIIDLRNNLGGDIFDMKNIAGLFLPKDSVIAEDVMRTFKWTHKSKKDQALKYEKIIILQNNNSASATENFIAALKDNLDNVLLIGDTTYGKGIGQFTMPLKKGFAVKATTMLWYTPRGVNIHGKGIKPDLFYQEEDILSFAIKKIRE